MKEEEKIPEALQHAGSTMKLVMNAAKCQFGILTLVKNGRMANIVVGEAGVLQDQKKLGEVLREIQEKIGEMAAEAENENLAIEPGKTDQSFVKDEELGGYNPGPISFSS